MTKEEKWLVQLVWEEAYSNPDENPYKVYSTLDDCYSSYSNAKEKAYYDCVSGFSTDVRYFEDLAQRSFMTFTRILSHNTNFFTLLQGAYYFAKDGSLIALLRYDTYSRVLVRGFKMSKDGLEFKKTISDIGELIRANK